MKVNFLKKIDALHIGLILLGWIGFIYFFSTLLFFLNIITSDICNPETTLRNAKTEQTPEELKSDFDRDLLEQLVIGSFSSDYELKKEEKKDEKELYIAVKS